MSKPFLDNTVLVLGAGASKPYGFPLGVELKNHLVGTSNEPAIRALDTSGHQKGLVNDFQEALRYTAHATIDIFLEYKRNFREIGAFFIAAAIGQQESDGNLFPQRDWYADLFQLLNFETLGEDFVNVSIVTLNYDRSLEHFLRKNIDYNCRYETLQQCHERRARLRIVHAHGSIGPYPEIAYGQASRNQQSIRRAAEAIKIVSDRLDESPDFRAAQDVIAQARHVIFLGFGYDNRTLQSLLLGVDRDQTRFYGTAMNLGDKARRAVLEFFHDKISLGEERQDCVSFFRESILNTKL